MAIKIVIGKNFGDEGKGLATDYFARTCEQSKRSCLVIRHNGGAQAGHTVDIAPDRRFIFHQLSSGSFRHADTLWSSTFLPDLYKLPEEKAAFEALAGFVPKIYCAHSARCVTIDDVLVNMLLETARGENRHGSCGMGINEAVCRSTEADFKITFGYVKGAYAEDLLGKLKHNRQHYIPHRLQQEGLCPSMLRSPAGIPPALAEYCELLRNDTVLQNVAEIMCRCAEDIMLWDEECAPAYEDYIFEGAQGLLLDEDYLEYAPHLTTSKTGLTNPKSFCDRYFCPPLGGCKEIIYVTRAYVTRHGAGPLPYEADLNAKVGIDQTNIPNPWQGAIRYAAHPGESDFLQPVIQDLSACGPLAGDYAVSILVTHLNQSHGQLICANGSIPLEQWKNCTSIQKTFGRFYLSKTPYAKDIVRL